MTENAEDGADCIRFMREARHRVIIPKHRKLRLGAVGGIQADVSELVGQPNRHVCETLFG